MKTATTKILDTKITLLPGVTIELTPLQERFLVKIIEQGEVEPWKGKEVALEDILGDPQLPELLLARTVFLISSPLAYMTNPNEDKRIKEISFMLAMYGRGKSLLRYVNE